MGNGSAHEGEASESPLVDESLIDAMMALSPEERLRQNDRMVRTILLLRQGRETPKAGHDGRER
jgi:hypothetical protein